MTNQRHMILKQKVEVTVPSSEQAWPLQEQISKILRTKIKPLIERACDSLSTPDCLHRIERLELDLGFVDANNLSKQLPALFDEAFKRALGKAVAQPDPSGLPSKVASQWELFTQFIREGTLPWWADLTKPHQVEDSIDYLLSEAPELIRQGLPILALDLRGLRRMIRQLQDRQLAFLVSLQIPALGEFGWSLFQSMTHSQNHIPLLSASQSSGFRVNVWQSILQNALLPELTPADRTDFARGVLMRLAHLQGVSYPAVVQAFSIASGSLQNQAQAIADDLMHELDAMRHDQTPDNQELHEFGGKTANQAHRDFQYLEKPSHDLAEQETNQFARKSSNESHNEFINTTYLPLDNRENDQEGIILGNAGLVILWPFIGELFERLGFAKEKTIVNETARQRAVALLHYLCTGNASIHEYLLPLNKVLCGMELTTVFEHNDPLTQEETNACDSLITSVIEQIPILENMSINGFRGNFIIRTGILLPGNYGWLLRVERETYDVVLEHFPWQFDWVKLPWMQSPLQVEW